MPTVTLPAPDDFDAWRIAARTLVASGLAPEAVTWVVAGEGGDLLGATSEAAATGSAQPFFTVPKAFIDLARRVICNADPERFALLHRALDRLRDQPRLREDAADPLVRRLELLDKGVRRDVHKMRAFVRFRAVRDESGDRFVAWFEPEHHIVRLNSGFFVRRFASMRWSILTPESCVHWDGEALAFTPGATRAEAPDGDPLEETWKTYYASTFNPARLKIGAMTREMPKKYWKDMPETALIPELVAGAANRTRAMIVAGGDAPGDTVMPRSNAESALAALREGAAQCQRCDLWRPATRVVFGQGPADAALMLVGEQPGDQEGLAGRPFVGPAGQLLDRALGQAGIDRARAYVTNAVKHFKFEQRGKRRIHAKPNGGEIEACRWWIGQERDLVRPAVTVALGASAAQSLTGRAVTISRERGRPHALPDGSELWITVHPSFLLRLPDPAAAEIEFGRFVADLTAIRARVEALAGGAKTLSNG